MDTRQIEYILKIAEERSVTRAAEQLFITQSALSQQVQKLEKELDTSLFVRTKADWTPTPEGEIYLENARKILRIKHDTYTMIADRVNARKSYLSIGITPGRGPSMFTHIYPVFHKKFPEVILEPRELSVKKQQYEIRKGTLDLGVITLLESQKTKDHYMDLLDEELFLAVPKELAASLPPVTEAGSEADTISIPPEIDLTLFTDHPFILMYKESTQRLITDEIFRNAGFTPKILFETSSNQTILSMIQAGLCVGIVPWYYIKNCGQELCYYSLPDHPRWKICATYRKDAYLSNAAREFIRMVKNYYQLQNASEHTVRHNIHNDSGQQ